MSRDGRTVFSKPWKKNSVFFQPLENRRRADTLGRARTAERRDLPRHSPTPPWLTHRPF